MGDREIEKRSTNKSAWMLTTHLSNLRVNIPVLSSSKIERGNQSGLKEGLDILEVKLGSSLSQDERGAIWPMWPSQAFTPPDTFQGMTFDVPYEDIRTCLIFFDKFDIPDWPIFQIGDWCQGDLRAVGILSSSTLNAAGSPYNIGTRAPFAVFTARDKQEPGQWSLARPAIALGIPESELSRDTAAALTLQNALPTFTREVQLEDVLEFKVKRRSELTALRLHMDEVADQIRRSGANDFEASIAFKKFRTALEDYIKVMSESNRDKVWRSLRATFDMQTLLTSGAEVLYKGQIDYNTLATGVINIGIRTAYGLKRKRLASNPFEYLTSANLEL